MAQLEQSDRSGAPKKAALDEPLKLSGGVVIKNRFMKSATSEQMGDADRNPIDGLAILYRTWAEGGAGLLVSGNLMVDRSAIGEPRNVALDENSDLAKFKRWTSGTVESGAEFWAQINHPGKQVPIILSKEPVAPSAVPLEAGLEKAFAPPRALEEHEIEEIIAKFATTARLAKEVGFTGVQIHGAHGYLVSQFLSPRHNKRNDKWGGSLENRMRFVLEIYHAVRESVGDDFPVSIKLNSADFMKGGFTQEDSMRVVKALVDAGIDLIEISGGSYESPAMSTGDTGEVKESTRKREAYFLDYAQQIRELVDVPLAVTGGFRSRQGMDEALASGATDFIGLARPIILMPDLPKRAIADNSFRIEFDEPTTGFEAIDRMTMLILFWYEKQMHRMGKGRAPDPKLSPWGAALSSLWNVISFGSQKRRA